jgi:hypothetical protein
MPIFIAILAFAGGIVTAFGAVFGPLYLALVRRELTRSDEMHKVAGALGLAFSRTDPAYPSSTAFRFPFELFSRGYEQTCENLMTGVSGGVDLIAFDFLYWQQADADGALQSDVNSEPIRHSCAVTPLSGSRPHVVVEPASASRTARADGEPVPLEWGDFNARYRVVSPDRGFAAALLDLELMAWLVDEAPQLSLTWEVQRNQLLCRAPRLSPADVALLLRAVPEFACRISRGASD